MSRRHFLRKASLLSLFGAPEPLVAALSNPEPLVAALSSMDTSPLPLLHPQGTDDEMLSEITRETFDYFRKEVNPKNGLVPDKSQPGSACSIAVLGMTLSTYTVAVERHLLTRADAVNRTLTMLRFLHESVQGTQLDATGYRGFYYHFLDMKTGRRTWHSELSTIDTAILMAGVLNAGSYFSQASAEEQEIRELADALYRRVDWVWALNGGDTFCHGWKPETGFLPWRWDKDYSEALILYILAMGSPTFPIDPVGYREWTSTFKLKTVYGIRHLYAGPLFIHQMSHLWLDFRGIRDDFNRWAGFDYFENSRRATRVQRQYGIENPLGFAHYHEYGWGFTASDGPGPAVREVDGVERVFFDYEARGAPFGPDDGTISPWAVTASLPFEPKIVLATVRHAIERLSLKKRSSYGFDASFNPTFPETKRNQHGWVSPWIFGLNQGPIILMIENYQTDLIWKTMRQCPFVTAGLRNAGFRDGWLDDAASPRR